MRDEPEPRFRGHNWRRIAINGVGLLIERSRLKQAATLIDEIEAQLDDARWVKLRPTPVPNRAAMVAKRLGLCRTTAGQSTTGPTGSRSARIREVFGDQDGILDDCFSADFTHEEILALGLTTCYRGLIAHLRGRYRTAEEHYKRGISMLRRLGEQRAYALFQRHYATLRRVTANEDELFRQIEYSIAASASVRQMDISYRARILRAIAIRRSSRCDAQEHRSALEDIRGALEYAALTDAHRVRIEASAALAREMRSSGDYDTALKYATDALAIACRYGHSLQKVSLRVEIGQILIQRGDPKSGAAMIDRAVVSAMRRGNQRMVDAVQRSNIAEARTPP